MLVFYKEKKYLLISLLIIILDGIIMYLVPSYFNKLNNFYPMLTISFIPFVYLTNKKYSYLLIIVIGGIYDLLYSNIFLYNVIVFIILLNLDVKILKYFKANLLLLIIVSLLNIVIYDIIGFLLVMITGYQEVNISDLFYKIEHSIFLNIMLVFVVWFLFKKDFIHA